MMLLQTLQMFKKSRINKGKAMNYLAFIVRIVHVYVDYEQSHCFLIVRRERSEKNRLRESWPRESWCQERRKKRDYRQSLSV